MKTKTSESIIFCPRCRSHNVKKEITSSAALGAPQEWVCNNCGFRGHIFPQVKIEKENDSYKRNQI